MPPPKDNTEVGCVPGEEHVLGIRTKNEGPMVEIPLNILLGPYRGLHEPSCLFVSLLVRSFECRSRGRSTGDNNVGLRN